VVHLAPELSPYARTGGLGEAVASLAKYQAASGIPVTVFMPLYSRGARAPEIRPIGAAFAVTVGPRTETARLYEPAAPHQPGTPRVVFVESERVLRRPGLYGDDAGDYPDNARRYALFARAVLVSLPRSRRGAEHRARARLADRAREHLSQDGVLAHPYYEGIRAVLSVHNAGYQGHFPEPTMDGHRASHLAVQPPAARVVGPRRICSRAASSSPILVITVSPTHAHELRTRKGGFGLDGVFVALRDRLVGIVNGIDQESGIPRGTRSSRAGIRREPSGKKRCRLALQRATGLSRGRRRSSRSRRGLVAQKGSTSSSAIRDTSRSTRSTCSSGRATRATSDAHRARRARAEPHRVKLDFTDEFEHLLLAGADLCLMPSQYEPCGLTQMRAQRYGHDPRRAARRRAGDTIEDGVTGFLFDDYTPADFMRAAMRAVDQYRETEAWEEMMREAMARDFGWERSATRYLSVYRRVLGCRRAAGSSGRGRV
jgi:starch synthase